MSKVWYFLGNIKTRTWLGMVALVAAVERILLYVSYKPVPYNDTGGYRRLAEQVLAGWDSYDGTRMPGYPVFLAWLGPDKRVYIAQLALGLLITLLFFYIGLRMTKHGWFATLAAFTYTLNPQQVLVEADLLTETLTIFLLALCLAGLVWLLTSDDKRPFWQILLATLFVGLTAGVTVMVRTLFVFLPILAALVLLVFLRTQVKFRWAAALTAALAGLMIIGIWVNFIHQRFGMWSFDTMTGYHMMNNTGQYFEYVPDEYAGIRDTFIHYRNAQTAATANPGNAIWDAIPALEQVSGLGFIGLSNLLAKLSINLIFHHPIIYLLTIWEGWLMFWRVPVHWTPLTRPILAIAQRCAILLLRGMLFLINMVFIGGTLALVWKKARTVLRMDPFLWLLVGTTWAASVLQAVVEHGDNPRYSVPLQTLVLLVVLWWGLSLVLLKWKRKEDLSA